MQCEKKRLSGNTFDAFVSTFDFPIVLLLVFAVHCEKIRLSGNTVDPFVLQHLYRLFQLFSCPLCGQRHVCRATLLIRLFGNTFIGCFNFSVVRCAGKTCIGLFSLLSSPLCCSSFWKCNVKTEVCRATLLILSRRHHFYHDWTAV